MDNWSNKPDEPTTRNRGEGPWLESQRSSGFSQGSSEYDYGSQNPNTPGHVTGRPGQQTYRADMPDESREQIVVAPSEWSPLMRFAVGAAGGFLALRALRGDSPYSLPMGLVGVGLPATAAGNVDVSRLFGFGPPATRLVDVNETITLHAPVHEVYSFWNRLENFPRFMSHVRDVQETRTNHWLWTVDGPAGMPVTFDADVTEHVPDEIIAWRTSLDSMIQHGGSVRFQPAMDGGTKLIVTMSYNPPAGVVGHAVAKAFGIDPMKSISDDLQHLKSLIEEGQTTTHGETVRREQLAATPQSYPGQSTNPRQPNIDEQNY